MSDAPVTRDVSETRLAELAAEAAESIFDRDLALDLRYDGIESKADVRLKVRTTHPSLNPSDDIEGRPPIRHEAAFVLPGHWPDAWDTTAEEQQALVDRLGLTKSWDGQPVLATVYIDEIVGNIHAPRSDWFFSLDPLSGDLAELGVWLESLEEREDLFPDFEYPHRFAGGGSIFYGQELFVHPAARGQEAGLRLLGRTLTYLGRSTNDLAVLRPIAIPNRLDPTIDFEAERETFEPEITDGLIDYYARAGFILDDEYDVDGEACWMYRSFLHYHGEDRYWSITDGGA